MKCIHNCNCLNNARSEIAYLQSNISAVNSQLAEKQCQIDIIQNQLKYTQQQMITTMSELDERQNQINNLGNQLAELKLENSEKVSELKQKDDEIKSLKEKSGNTQKDFLSEKLHSKQEELENFATELGIELQKTQNLRKRYRELIMAREENRGNDIAVAKENITATREGLLERGVSADKVQKFCKKCKKTARLEVWVKEVQEQYEAKQEVPL
jgi:chromosome segregation ATPase